MTTYHNDAITIMLIFLRQFKGQHNDAQIQQGVNAATKLLPEVDAKQLFSDIQQLVISHPSLFIR